MNQLEHLKAGAREKAVWCTGLQNVKALKLSDVESIIENTHTQTIQSVRERVEARYKIKLMGALHKYGAWLLVNYEDVEPLERRYKKQEIVEDLLTDLLKDLEAPVEGEGV